MIKKLLFLLIINIIFTSCENESLAPSEELLGAQFFPIQVGNEYLYDVQEINYRNTGEVDTSYYQIIDRIVDSTLLNSGIQYLGYRYLNEPQSAEKVMASLSLTVNKQTVIQQIGTQKEVILSFPVREGKSWDAQLGSENEDEFYYYKAFQAYELSDTVFSQSVQVIEEDNQDSLEFLDTRINVYAAGIGTVERLSSQIEFCTLSECFGLKEIEIGKTIRMKRVLAE